MSLRNDRKALYGLLEQHYFVQVSYGLGGIILIKRTPEGLQWPIDRKIDHDLRNWPKASEKRPKKRIKSDAFNLEKKDGNYYEQRIIGKITS